MTGDVLYIGEKYLKLASELFENIEKVRNGQRFVVAITGESGSGKSVLSHCLSKEYKRKGILTKILCTDDYYKILPAQRTEWRQTHGAESIGYDEYDWETLNDNILSFRNKKIADTPSVDLLNDLVDRLIIDFSNIEILILDGLYSIKAKDIDYRVFIDITYHETKKAQIIRGKEELTPFREIVLAREHEMVAALKSLADYIVI